MFKKSIITSKSGKKYTLGTVVKQAEYNKRQLVTTEAGDQLLCITIDVNSAGLKRAQLEEFAASPNIMETVTNPNVLKIYDKVLTDKELHLIVTKFDMDLEEFLLKNKLDQSEAYFKLLANIFVAIYELFSKFKFRKNNFSLQNVFVKDADLLIGGFNLGVVGYALFPSSLGNYYYKAPELLMGDELEGNEKTDVWSMGVCLYSIYFGQLPFKAVDREDLLQEIKGWDKQKNSIKGLSNHVYNFIKRMVETDIDKRLSFAQFKDDYQIYNPDSKVVLAKKRIKRQLHKLGGEEDSKPSIPEGITDLNLKKKIETNLSTSLEFRENESFPLPNSETNFSKLSVSNSAVSTSYILTSEDELDDDVLRYLFEKNKIIFIMDGVKQAEQCAEMSANQAVKAQLQYLGLLLVKRAYVENYYIFKLMEANFNIFNLNSFQRICDTNAYSDIRQFFKDFMSYLKDTFHIAMPKYVNSDPIRKKQVDNFEKLSLNELNTEIGGALSAIAHHYRIIHAKLSAEDRKTVAKSCFFWLLLKQNFHTFEKFPKTEDWISFCQEIDENSASEIDKMLQANGL